MNLRNYPSPDTFTRARSSESVPDGGSSISPVAYIAPSGPSKSVQGRPLFERGGSSDLHYVDGQAFADFAVPGLLILGDCPPTVVGAGRRRRWPRHVVRHTDAARQFDRKSTSGYSLLHRTPRFVSSGTEAVMSATAWPGG